VSVLNFGKLESFTTSAVLFDTHKLNMLFDDNPNSRALIQAREGAFLTELMQKKKSLKMKIISRP
jgi:hypothetical protein